MSRKEKIRTGEAGNNPPPQVDSRAVWAYDTEREMWYILDFPTRDELIAHAEKFGPDLVAETAAECGFGVEELAQLIERLDVIALNRYKRDHKGLSGSFKRARSTPEKRAKKLLGITDEEVTEE